MNRVTRIDSTSILVTGMILSHPKLFEARQVNNQGVPKFTAALVWPSDMSNEDWALINTIIEAEKAKRWPGGAPASLQLPWKDAEFCDSSLKGRLAINVSAAQDRRPAVVMEDGATPADPGSIYPGMGVNVYLNVYAYPGPRNNDPTMKKGINFGINAVQIADRSLPRLDGRKAPTEVFSAVPTTGAPPPTSPTPHAPTPAVPGAPQTAPAAPAGAPVPPGAPGAPQPPTAPQQPAPPQPPGYSWNS